MSTIPFAAAVHQERQRQEEAWGEEHDDGHSPNDWLALIIRRLGLAQDESLTDFQQRMVEVAALAQACWESAQRFRRRGEQRIPPGSPVQVNYRETPDAEATELHAVVIGYGDQVTHSPTVVLLLPNGLTAEVALDRVVELTEE